MRANTFEVPMSGRRHAAGRSAAVGRGFSARRLPRNTRPGTIRQISRGPSSELFARAAVALAVLVGALGLAASPAWARNIYLVNSNGDGADANTADGMCR